MGHDGVLSAPRSGGTGGTGGGGGAGGAGEAEAEAVRVRDHIVGCFVLCSASHRPLGSTHAEREKGWGLRSSSSSSSDVGWAGLQSVRG